MNVNGKNQNQRQAVENQPTLKQWVAKMSKQIECALPKNYTPERMMRIALTAISKDAKLAQCTPDSFMGALLTAAQLGLEVNTPLGQAYLIPFWNGKKGVLEAQFQLGYQGLLDLCYRTGKYKDINARIVYEGDDFDFSYGLDENLVHRPKGKTSNPIFVYAYYKMINGTNSYEVMSWKDVMEHSQTYSQSVKKGYDSPWKTSQKPMAKKTLLIQALRYAPKTVEVAEAVSSDSAIINTTVTGYGQDVVVNKDFDFLPENVTDVEGEKVEQKQVQESQQQKEHSYEPTDAELKAELDAEFDRQAEEYASRDIPEGLF